MIMKKFGSLLMSALLCASLLAGCSSSASVSQSTVPETISTAEGAIETGSEEVSLEEMTAAKQRPRPKPWRKALMTPLSA